jgi:hypothetical protein
LEKTAGKACFVVFKIITQTTTNKKMPGGWANEKRKMETNNPNKKTTEFLKESLDGNRKKLQVIADQMLEKNQELAKLKAELTELEQLYIGNKKQHKE